MTTTRGRPPAWLFAFMALCMSIAVTPPSSIHKLRCAAKSALIEAQQAMTNASIAPAIAQER
jgi:hypothetical protein